MENLDWANLIETTGPANTSIYRRRVNKNACPMCGGPKAECWNDGTKDLTTTLIEAERSRTSIERSIKNEEIGHNLNERAESIPQPKVEQAAHGGTNGR